MSNKQKAASRANGAKSRGPKTEEGCRRSSQNSTKHGLYSSAVVLTNEDQESFVQLRQSYIHRFQPADVVELGFVEQMVAATWRRQRVWAMETEALEGGMDRITPELDRKFKEYPEETRICAAMESIWKGAPNSLEFLSRNESRLARLHHRALHDLLKLRQLVPPPADAPEEIVLPPDPSEPASPQDEIVEHGYPLSTNGLGGAGGFACQVTPCRNLEGDPSCSTKAPSQLDTHVVQNEPEPLEKVALQPVQSKILRNEPETTLTPSVSDSNQPHPPGPFLGPRPIRIMRASVG